MSNQTTQGPDLGSRAGTAYKLVGIFSALSASSLALRFYARRSMRTKLALDDYLAVFCFAEWIGFVVVMIWGARHGGGFDYDEIPLPDLKFVLKATYVTSLLTPCLMTTAKLSILCLYHRVFSTNINFKVQNMVVVALCSAWCVAAFLAVMLQCIPMRGGWDPLERVLPTTRCIDFSAFTVGIEVPNGILDFIVAGVALNVIQGLKMNTMQKAGLAGLLVLCTLVAVVGAIRIGITYNPRVWSAWATGEWIIVQNGLCVICCSLPTYGSLIAKAPNPISALKTYFTSPRGSADAFQQASLARDASREFSQSRQYLQLNRSCLESMEQITTVARTSSSKQNTIPMGMIGVRSTLDCEVQCV